MTPSGTGSRKVLVVFAHPQRDSFCGAVLDQVVATVEDAQGTVRVQDLYDDGFDPRLTIVELEREHQGGPRTEVAPEIRRAQQDVLWADAVVFICPLWWSDVPAVLKGWFDRVWTNGFAWSYDGEPELTRAGPRQALFLISAGHTRDKLAADGVIRALDAVVVGDRLRNVGFDPVELVVLDDLVDADENRVRILLEQARDAAGRLR